MSSNKVGGITTAAGITFVGKRAKVTVREVDGMFMVQKYSNPSNNKYGDIPFLRGFLKLFNALKMAFGTLVGKISVFFLTIGFLGMIAELLFGSPTTTSKDVDTMFTVMFVVTNAVVIIAILGYTLFIRNLHAVEHRLITLYKKRLPLVLENVKSQPKETPQCGGTLLGVMLLIEILWVFILRLPSEFVWILFPSLGFELFLLADGNKWYNKVLYFPGLMIQKISTGNGADDKTIKKYLIGFRAFVAQEDPDYPL